ncbi:MAG: peptidylprolyl isomerase, partial [Anaerolineae bacterium]|nr:peptidylprolyl isomerase [Anaerolineae bacterium]
NNFVFLAQNGYYNNTTFHRVIADFMAQGGDPTGTGTGGPGYQFDDEFVGYWTFDEPGRLAMANAGAGTNGSQFFITTVPTTHLDFRHTIFGVVLEGQDSVAAIRLRDPETDPAQGTLLQTVVIVTDPATVQTSYAAPELATKDDVTAALDGVAAILPEGVLAVDTALSGTFDADQVVAAAPEGVQADYQNFLAANHFEYRVANTVTNAACDLESMEFASLSYTLDAFATREDAAAALAGDFLPQLTAAQGLSPVEPTSITSPFYTASVTACDVAALKAVTYWQRGRFIVTAEVVLTAQDLIPLADQILTQFVALRVYDPLLGNVFRHELH